MIIFCSKCKINWAKLWEEGSETSDVYEFCPVCKSDRFLEDGKDLVSYTMCRITGRIINVDTGAPMISEKKKRIRVVVGKTKRVYDETYEEFREREAAVKQEAIDSYLFLCEQMPCEMAAKKTEWPMLQRKFLEEHV